MTDREPVIPADPIRPPSFRPRINPLVGDLSANAHLEPAPRGDCLPMSLTLAPRPPIRHSGTDEPPVDSLWVWLAQISSPTPNLSAFTSVVLPGSHQRNPAEAHAAARAAACPDLFAIHAPDQTARERVISDLVWATGSERALVLSTDAATADRIVERLVKVEVDVVRALAEDENPIRPSPLVAKATSAARFERLKQDMATGIANATARLNAIVAAASAHAQLAERTQRRAAIDAEIANANTQRERLQQQVQLEAAGTEMTAFTTLVDQRKTERQATVDIIHQQRLTALAIHKEKESRVADLRKQTAEATTEAGKKSGFFTRLLGKHKQSTDAVELGKQLHQAEQELSEIEATISTLQRDLEATSAKLLEEQDQLIQAEFAIRQAQFDSRLAQLMTESNQLGSEIEAMIRALEPNFQTAEECAVVQKVAESELAAARQRAIELDRSPGELGKRMVASVRVAVGTPGSLSADTVFEQRAEELHSEPPFGLLVLDRAEELTEHDFLHLAKLAKRWVLIGDLIAYEEPRSSTKTNPSRHTPGFGRNGRSIEIPFAARLARVLDREKWAYEADRLVCRLEHLSLDARRNITREPLLDRPEIELRFTTSSEGEPVLAEVAFPPATSIATAKSFLYHQLSEVLLRPPGTVAWQSTPAAIIASWGVLDRASSASETAWIDLEPGVREKVVGTGLAAFTAAVVFDTTVGWNIEKAEMWLNEHLPAQSPCRFASIPRR